SSSHDCSHSAGTPENGRCVAPGWGKKRLLTVERRCRGDETQIYRLTVCVLQLAFVGDGGGKYLSTGEKRGEDEERRKREDRPPQWIMDVSQYERRLQKAVSALDKWREKYEVEAQANAELGRRVGNWRSAYHEERGRRAALEENARRDHARYEERLGNLQRELDASRAANWASSSGSDGSDPATGRQYGPAQRRAELVARSSKGFDRESGWEDQLPESRGVAPSAEDERFQSAAPPSRLPMTSPLTPRSRRRLAPGRSTSDASPTEAGGGGGGASRHVDTLGDGHADWGGHDIARDRVADHRRSRKPMQGANVNAGGGGSAFDDDGGEDHAGDASSDTPQFCGAGCIDGCNTEPMTRLRRALRMMDSTTRLKSTERRSYAASQPRASLRCTAGGDDGDGSGGERCGWAIKSVRRLRLDSLEYSDDFEEESGGDDDDNDDGELGAVAANSAMGRKGSRGGAIRYGADDGGSFFGGGPSSPGEPAVMAAASSITLRARRRTSESSASVGPGRVARPVRRAAQRMPSSPSASLSAVSVDSDDDAAIGFVDTHSSSSVFSTPPGSPPRSFPSPPKAPPALSSPAGSVTPSQQFGSLQHQSAAWSQRPENASVSQPAKEADAAEAEPPADGGADALRWLAKENELRSADCVVSGFALAAGPSGAEEKAAAVVTASPMADATRTAPPAAQLPPPSLPSSPPAPAFPPLPPPQLEAPPEPRIKELYNASMFVSSASRSSQSDSAFSTSGTDGEEHASSADVDAATPGKAAIHGGGSLEVESGQGGGNDEGTDSGSGSEGERNSSPGFGNARRGGIDDHGGSSGHRGVEGGQDTDVNMTSRGQNVRLTAHHTAAAAAAAAAVVTGAATLSG
ncbi:unnamed protein product, partial [Phaeothamnion confervicola]